VNKCEILNVTVNKLAKLQNLFSKYHLIHPTIIVKRDEANTS
jgi:hypothetical protein